jgi:hypothetical protein
MVASISRVSSGINFFVNVNCLYSLSFPNRFNISEWENFAAHQWNKKEVRYKSACFVVTGLEREQQSSDEWRELRTRSVAKLAALLLLTNSPAGGGGNLVTETRVRKRWTKLLLNLVFVHINGTSRPPLRVSRPFASCNIRGRNITYRRRYKTNSSGQKQKEVQLHLVMDDTPEDKLGSGQMILGPGWVEF